MAYEKLGNWAFIIGVIIAIIAGFLGTVTYEVSLVLVVLGLIIGFINIAQKESVNFLIAAIALLAVGAAGLGTIPIIGEYIGSILTNISTFVAPAAVIIALKAIYQLAYKKK